MKAHQRAIRKTVLGQRPRIRFEYFPGYAISCVVAQHTMWTGHGIALHHCFPINLRVM